MFSAQQIKNQRKQVEKIFKEEHLYCTEKREDAWRMREVVYIKGTLQKKPVYSYIDFESKTTRITVDQNNQVKSCLLNKIKNRFNNGHLIKNMRRFSNVQKKIKQV